MKSQKVGIMFGFLAVIAVGHCGETNISQQTQSAFSLPVFSTGAVTPLVACQAVPASLSGDLRRWYNDLCVASNASERIQALYKMPKSQPSEMADLLPLLFELTTTGDSAHVGELHSYVAIHAAGNIAEAGAAAVPFAIKALQSKKAVEVHAGLWCVASIITALELRGETNELSAVSRNLFPHLAAQSTNSLSGEKETTLMMGVTIAEHAKLIEQKLKRALPFEMPEPCKGAIP